MSRATYLPPYLPSKRRELPLILHDVIIVAGNDESAMNPRQIMGKVSRNSQQPLPKPLTLRESEILGHLALGKTNRQIASELYLSLSTLKRHLEHILPKLKVSDRTQAALKAIELGPVPPSRRE